MPLVDRRPLLDERLHPPAPPGRERRQRQPPIPAGQRGRGRPHQRHPSEGGRRHRHRDGVHARPERQRAADRPVRRTPGVTVPRERDRDAVPHNPRPQPSAVDRQLRSGPVQRPEPTPPPRVPPLEAPHVVAEHRPHLGHQHVQLARRARACGELGDGPRPHRLRGDRLAAHPGPIRTRLIAVVVHQCVPGRRQHHGLQPPHPGQRPPPPVGRQRPLDQAAGPDDRRGGVRHAPRPIPRGSRDASQPRNCSARSNANRSVIPPT